MAPFTALLISHLLGDVILNSSRLARLKRGNGIGIQVLALAFHTGIHALLAGLLLFLSGSPWLKGAILVLGAHFFIDFTRCRLEFRVFGPGGLVLTRPEILARIFRRPVKNPPVERGPFRIWLLFNLMDQGLHLISLYLIGRLL